MRSRLRLIYAGGGPMLSLEPSLPIGRAVAEANETLGIDPVGSIAQQVEVLMSECSLDGHA